MMYAMVWNFTSCFFYFSLYHLHSLWSLRTFILLGTGGPTAPAAMQDSDSDDSDDDDIPQEDTTNDRSEEVS